LVLVLLLRRVRLRILGLGHGHILLALLPWDDHLGLPLLCLSLLLVPMVHLHLLWRVLLLVLLLILRSLAILLISILRLLWSVLSVRAASVAVLLAVSWIHGYCVSCGKVRSPGVILCHDIVTVCEVGD
jgi:hypothetical protein